MPILTRQGAAVHFVERGPRLARTTPVVLIHGLLDSGEGWSDAALLLARDRLVITIDLRGHGGSSRAPEPTSIGDLADDVAALLDAIEAPRAAIAGVSLGAIVALHVAARRPDRIAALAMVSADVRAEDPQRRERYRATLGAAARLGARPVLRALAAVMFGKTSLTGRAALVEAWIERAAALDPEAFMPVVEAALEREDARPLLAKVPCPALVVRGAEDRLVGPDAIAEISERLPRGEAMIIEGAGHLAPMERPEAIAAAIADLRRRGEESDRS